MISSTYTNVFLDKSSGFDYFVHYLFFSNNTNCGNIIQEFLSYVPKHLNFESMRVKRKDLH